MVILNRNINIEDNRELVEDVTAQEIADKGRAFTETFWQVHQAYVRSRQVGRETHITDRKTFTLVDNLLWVEEFRAIDAAVLSLRRVQQPNRFSKPQVILRLV